MATTMLDEAKALIQSSGNNFHAKVARWFSDNHWNVRVSPYYLDALLDKTREIDLIAERSFRLTNHWRDPIGNLVVRLFIECKYINATSVFWFAPKDMPAAKELVTGKGIYHDNNSFTYKHHYLAGSEEVAKVFASATRPDTENEPVYKALNQVLSAQRYMESRPPMPGTCRSDDIKGLISLPVIVFNSFDKCFRTNFFADPDPQQINDNFQLEVWQQYQLIDIVSYDKLEQIQAAIEADVDAARVFLDN